MNKYVKRTLIFVALAAVWELLSRLNVWPPYLFPSPKGVAAALAGGFADRSFPLAVATSMKRVFYGYGFALAAGITAGLVMGRARVLDESVRPLFLGIGTIPSICWLPVGLLWFGLNEGAIFFVVVMGSLFSVAVAVDDGVRNIPPIYLKAASTMGAKGLKKYMHVILPAALPSIVSGMKTGWAFAWRSLMAGEMLYVNLGLGHQLMMGRELNDINQVAAVMAIIVAIGMLADRFVFAAVENRIRARWGLKPSSE